MPKMSVIIRKMDIYIYMHRYTVYTIYTNEKKGRTDIFIGIKYDITNSCFSEI